MPKIRRLIYFLLVLLTVANIFMAPVQAANITRSCDAYYRWETTGGTFGGTFAGFTGRGGCGSSLPNRCRHRARDAAMGCMTTHRDTRWERRRPEACLNAAGVYGYNVGLPACRTTASNTCISPRNEVPQGDLKTRLEVEACCAFGKPAAYKQLRCAKDVHVRLTGVATGSNDNCKKTRTLFNDYVIEDCSAVWNNICRQTPQQPSGC